MTFYEAKTSTIFKSILEAKVASRTLCEMLSNG